MNLQSEPSIVPTVEEVISAFDDRRGWVVATNGSKLRSEYGLCALVPLFSEALPKIRNATGRIHIMFDLIPLARRHPQVVEIAKNRLQDRSAAVRMHACEILAYSLRHDAIPSLEQLLDHPVAETRLSLRSAFSAADQAERAVGNVPRDSKFIFHFWKVKKRILSKDYGISWRTPAEINPHIQYASYGQPEVTDLEKQSLRQGDRETSGASGNCPWLRSRIRRHRLGFNTQRQYRRKQALSVHWSRSNLDFFGCECDSKMTCCRLTMRWSGRVTRNVRTQHSGARAAQRGR